MLFFILLLLSPASYAGIPCSQITDSFCELLWNPVHEGNLRYGDSEIQIGKSEKSEHSYLLIAQLEDLLRGYEFFPDDLKTNLKEVFDEIREHLNREIDSSKWTRRMNALSQRYTDIVQDTADERTEKAHPDLKSVKKEDRTLEMRGKYTAAFYDLLREIHKAKFENSPNWKRVERIFDTVKADTLAEVAQFNLPPELVSRLLKKVQSVELVLPTSDPRILGNDGIDGCDTVTYNAFYTSTSNKLTICAGFFNGFRSDSTLYFVMAHELGHSIDPVNLSSDMQDESAFSLAVDKLFKMPMKEPSCSEWEQFRKDYLGLSPAFQPLPHPYQKLTECFSSTTNLKPMDETALRPIIQTFSTHTISRFATSNSFTHIAQPTLTKKGKVTPNELYLRPDLWAHSRRAGLEIPENFLFQDMQYGVARAFSHFFQCSQCTNNVKTSSSSDQVCDAFDKAIEDTTRLVHAAYEDAWKYCGQECSSLTSYQFSRNNQEYFADWLAGKTFQRYLSRENSVQTRREKAALAIAVACTSPGATKDAPHFTAREKKHSLEPHGDNRHRRFAIFTAETAKLLECEIDEDIEKVGTWACSF